jgi:ATP adenylyltransferase
MEQLWSPWRLAYVTGDKTDPAGCIFCNALERADAESLIVFRGRTCYVILNLYPYNNGHLLIVPNRHVGSLAGTAADEREELMGLTRLSEIALAESYAPHGFNVGINLGRPAGAGVLDHLHIHVVPRWNGDTNFMPVIGQVRVLPEELPVTAEKLRPVFQRLAASDRS